MDSQQSVGLVAVLGMRFRTYSNGVSNEMGGGHRRVMSRVFGSSLLYVSQRQDPLC